MVAIVDTLPAMPRKLLPLSEKKAPVAARVDPAILHAVEQMADADDRTVSYMVEKALREFVDRHAPKPAAGAAKKKP